MSGDRCVLWISRGQRPDSELLGALDRKGLEVEVCADPFEALARVCVASRAGNDRSAARASVMLLCDPETLDRVGEVTRLTDRYAPRARLWVFDSGSRRLRGAGKEETDRWSGTEMRSPADPAGPTRGPIGAQGARPTPRSEPRPSPHAAARPNTPALRLSGNGSLPTRPDDGEEKPDKSRATEAGPSEPAPAGPAGLLSDEELAMLLSTDDPARHD